MTAGSGTLPSAEPGAPLGTTAGRGRERFEFLHALRGIAALLVVWSHLSGFWLLEHGKTSALQDLWQQWIVLPFHVFQNGGHLGVILFFLISGFVITHTSLRETHREFAVKRLMRIYPPLFAALLISWVLIQFAAATGDRLPGVNDAGIARWFAAVLLLDGFVPGVRILDVTWTLVIEMVFYAITFALLGLSRRNPLLATWVMLALWVALVLLAFNVPIFAAVQNSAVVVYTGFLILGRAIYLWRRSLIGPFDGAIIAVSAGLLTGLFLETSNPGFLLTPGGWSGVEPLVSYVAALLIFLVMMRINPKRVVQPFRLLGDVSYSLYLLHLPVGLTVLNLLDGVGVPESLNTIIAILASVGVAWVSYRLVERPSQRLARRMLPQRKIA